MPYAFAHLIGAWLVGKIYQKITKTKLGHYGWFFLLLGGILPDIDFLLDWTIKTDLHRTLTHSLLFALIMAGLVFLFSSLFLRKKKEFANQKLIFSIAIGLGILTHLALDSISNFGVPLFWPLDYQFSVYHGSFIFEPAPELAKSAATLAKEVKAAIIDMALGTTWIFYLWFRRKLEF